MIYKDDCYCFSPEEIKDITQCLQEYKVHMEIILKQKKPINKALKKAYKERLDYFDMLFLNLQEIRNNVEFKRELSV